MASSTVFLIALICVIFSLAMAGSFSHSHSHEWRRGGFGYGGYPGGYGYGGNPYGGYGGVGSWPYFGKK
uniref:Uncharacterized protein n=1 Tax=Panagrolaimus sp. ES5 TaxID=591445 RepID=A0AC34FD87_9BILA